MTRNDATPDMLEAALAYRNFGWSVIPFSPKEKRPLVLWKDYQENRADEEQIRRWFADRPDANVGIVTGAVSGVVVLDIDPAHGGAEQLEALERFYGALPDTVEAETGGGGRHLFFRHPGGAAPNKVGIRDGIDLRGDGGVVVAPPSVHPAGRRYRWRPGHRPDERAPAVMPTWLRRVVLGERGPGRGHPLSHWRQLAREGVIEGARNDTIASFAGHLLFHEVDPDVVTELLLCWNAVKCKPPLPVDEVVRTVESIRRTHEREHEDGP